LLLSEHPGDVLTPGDGWRVAIGENAVDLLLNAQSEVAAALGRRLFNPTSTIARFE
jgi:hypothetical protein